MINIEKETLLSLTDTAKVMPKVDGKELHASTLWRWCRRGLRGVRLEHVRLGHRVCTSLPAVSRFVNALAEVETLTPADCRNQQLVSQPGSEVSNKRAETPL